MPFDGHIACTNECDFVRFPFLVDTRPYEGPSSSIVWLKVFVRHPAARFLGMPPFGPRPQRFEDGSVHLIEGCLAHHMPVIVGPAPDHGVELGNQIRRCGLFVGLHDLPDFTKSVSKKSGIGVVCCDKLAV
jgi:hypothetical protein